MPQRSKILTLPDNVKTDLNKKLIEGGFAGYEALSEWLSAQGYEISKSALHRYGSEFEQRLGAIRVATEQARAVVEAAGDEKGFKGEALMQLVQEKAFQALVKMEDAGDMSLASLGRMVADLNRASIAQKKWMEEIKQKTAKVVENVEKKLAGKIDQETLKKVREEVYGIGS
mgnify:CR=1 FL=1